MNIRALRITVLVILLVSAVICLLIIDDSLFESLIGYPSAERYWYSTKNSLRAPEASADSPYRVTLNGLLEFDFKSKDELLSLRSNLVLQHSEFLANGYEPDRFVFGQIIDQKPWWGMYGIFFHGNGQLSIDGPSEESRFFANPFVLVSVLEPHAYRTSLEPDESKAYWPRPIELIYDLRNTKCRLTYDLGSHLRYLRENNYPGREPREFLLVAYNARDFGYNYLHVNGEQSLGVTFSKPTSGVMLIPDYIHLGGSCGYSGGCNNMSPHADWKRFQVNALPAKLLIKLWKRRPRDASAKEDLRFLIRLR